MTDQKFCSQARKNTKQVLVNNHRSLHILSQDLFRLQDHRFSQTSSEFRNEESDHKNLQKDTLATQH